MTHSSDTSSPDLDVLRNQLVDDIAAAQTLPVAVEHALRGVPRDLFLPGLDPADAYTDQAVTIKANPDGPLALSCASVPSVVAMMLAQLDARPGDRVLEIGAGTGYNAALLERLVGPTGHVTTLDIDPDVALHARTALNRAGLDHVTVIERDGLLGAPEHAPYDRMIATVGMWDIPTTWWAQLADNGRVVLPLRWRGQTQSVALTRRGDTLISDDMQLCGFVPVIGQDGEHTTRLAEDTVRLHHDQDQPIDSGRLRDVLSGPVHESWSATQIGPCEPFDGIWLRATATTGTVCRIEITNTALEQGVRRPVVPIRTPALVRGDSLAYLIAHRDPADPEPRARLGAVGYGPDGPTLAHALNETTDAWSTARTARPDLHIHPRHGTTSASRAGLIVKPDTTLALSVPATTHPDRR